jgi:hypothetical protein
MESIKIKARTYTENEFEIPKYFKVAHHHYMIIDDKNYLFVKSELENSLYFYPEISIGQIEVFSSRWYEYSIKQELIPITEQEFTEEYNKASIYFQTLLIEEKWNRPTHKMH